MRSQVCDTGCLRSGNIYKIACLPTGPLHGPSLAYAFV